MKKDMHWDLNKMNEILQMNFSNAYFSLKMPVFFIKISLKCVPHGSLDNKSALVQEMAWYPNRQLLNLNQGCSNSITWPVFFKILIIVTP